MIKNIEEMIGNTPVFKLPTDENMAEIYVKIESKNLGGSVKDRIVVEMLNKAESEGRLKKGDTIVEPTSGNTGIGLALIGKTRGYNVVIVMPDTMSVERRRLIGSYGGEIILTEGAKGMKGAIAKATELVAEKGYFMPNQFENIACVTAHKKTTAPEIFAEFEDSLDAFVAGVGTGGTITGVGEFLKEKGCKVSIIAVEPASSPVLSGGSPSPHKIQGIGAGFIPIILNTEILDGIEKVENDDAINAAIELRKFGLLVGISTGAAYVGAINVAKRLGKGKKVLFIAPDNGERYLA